MTTEPSPSESRPRDQSDLQDEPTIWSQRLLDWNPVDPASSRAELLRRLTERDYFLTRDETDAALFIVSPDSPELTTRIREQFAERGTSVRLKDSVRRFAERFFDLPFMERLVQFNELKVLCAEEPYLLAWLDGLSSGLDVERPPIEGDEAFDRLVTACIEIFLAPPREASRKRQEFIHASREEPDIWGRAAIRLHLNHNQFTMRAAAWTRKLADWQQVERRYQQAIEQLNRSVCSDPVEERVFNVQHAGREEVVLCTEARDEKLLEIVFRLTVVFVIFICGAETWKAYTRSIPTRVQIPQPETMRRLPGTSSPEGESTSKVDEKSTQPEHGVNPEYKSQLKDLLRMSPEKRAVEFARDPRLKVAFHRLMKEVSELISKQKSDSAGKSNRSESNDQ